MTRDVSGRLGMRDLEDEVLVRWVAEAGNEAALSELYDRYAAVILGSGKRFLGDRGLAEDLLQDVFVSVWKNAAGFDPSKASFATWIHRITRNRATDLIRRRQARVRTVDTDAVPEPSEDDATDHIYRSFEVNAALVKLSAAHREVLTLAYFEGLSQREISTRANIPLGTVKSRTTAALRSLRKDLEHSDGKPEYE